jgi:enamine deaminase RidA (YjgF/YER057c/UK114 family)
MNGIRRHGGATRRAMIGLMTTFGLGSGLKGRETSAKTLSLSTPASETLPADHPSALRQEEGDEVELTVTHLNPEGVHANAAYSQAVAVTGNAKTIYVGGQNAVNAEGQVVGAGDMAAQTEQVLANMETILAAAGASLHDVIKWTVYVVQGHDFMPGFAVFQEKWGTSARPPVVTAAIVSGLANPEFLLEIEAVAVVGASAATA